MQNLTPFPNVNNDIEQRIAYERIRQAHNAFNLAFAATAVSSLFSLIGATNLLLGKIPAGSITTAKGANDRLDKLIAELDHES